MTIEELKSIKEQHGDGIIAVRGLAEDEQYNVGDTCRRSYTWDFEADCSTYYTTGEQLDGTCSLYIAEGSLDDEELAEAVEKINSIVESGAYGNEQVLLYAEYGDMSDANDQNEIVLEDAVVIAKL